MKRFVVLCAVVAVFSLYVPSTWATAPAISDLPDVRCLTGGGGPPKGVISSGLNQVELDAYKLEDFIKDFDDAVGTLTISVTGTTMIDPPPTQIGNTDTPLPVIELDTGGFVDVYGRASAGWARYTAEADDGTNPVTQVKAVAKYSTFAMGTPSLSEGRFFDLTAGGWQFTYVWTGQNIVVNDLDSTISPATSVDWEAYFNEIDYLYDPNGNLLGIDPKHVAHGSSFTTAGGWNVAISATGGLVVSPGATFSPGPFLIGILAINQSDPDDIDATRVMVSDGLLALTAPGGHDPATHEKSETLDGLTTGAITPSAMPSADIRVPIQEGCHWGYHFLGDDVGTLSPASLAVVDLATDSLLPAAASVAGLPGSIAGGNGIRATLVPSTALPTGGFRLMSRIFDGLQAGDVLTISVNVATDVQQAINSPTFLMALASPLGAGAMGSYIEHYAFGAAAAGTVLENYQRDIIPLNDEGWQTISANYTPPLTRHWYDTDLDGDMDQTDLDNLAGVTLPNYGFSDERTAAQAVIKVWTRTAMTATTHMWLDNLRVYRSAYELDLGLEKTAYSAAADISGILPPAFIGQTSGGMDGSIESYAGNLEAIGFRIANADGAGEAFRPAGSKYVSAAASSISVNTAVDHTKSGGSSNCLQIALVQDPADPDGTNTCVKAWVESAIVAVPGSGIYCLEVFFSKQRATNSLATDRTPSITAALMQMAPNALGPVYGAYLEHGGGPISVGEETNNWMRIVGTGYINQAQLVRCFVQVAEAFDASVSNFSVPNYFDDFSMYRVDDPAKFFDADLFDSN